MKTLNRKQKPEIKTIEKVSLLKPVEIKLDNGIPLFSINAGTQDVIKIECVFDAGTWYQDKKLVAYSTIKMLTEGTKDHTAAELSEIFDSYGSYVETEAEKDHTFISLYSLNKHLEKLLPVFYEMIKGSVFPSHELSVLLSNTRQEQQVSMQRVNYMAKVKFAEQLFGKDHPYGQKAAVEDYGKVTREDLVEFHKRFYHPGNLRIVVSGKINDKAIKLINKYFGDKKWRTLKKAEMKKYKILSASEKKYFLPKENAIQSGLRIGKILFNKKHPDFFGMYILNTILGGYFGSRLMTNIREDKGYTYGIGSGLVSMKNTGYIFIASEVGSKVRGKAVEEIYNEIETLKNIAVSKKELDLVKNYLTGTFLRGIDGPFAIADKFLGLLDYGFDFNEYFERYISTLKEITPEKLKSLAVKYFEADSFYETVIGK
jgi:zinc protease